MVDATWREVVVVRDKMSKAMIAHDWVIGTISTVLLEGAMGAVVIGLDYGPDAVAGFTGSRRPWARWAG